MKKKKKRKNSSVEIKSQLNSCFNDVTVKWVSRFDYLSDWVLPLHIHNEYYQIIFIIDGKCNCTVEDVEYVIDKPCIIFVRPNICHGIYNVGKNGLKTLDVKFNINTPILKEKCNKISPINFVYEYDYKGIFETIIEEGKEQEEEFQTYCQVLMGAVLVKLIRFSQEENRNVEVNQQLFDTNHISNTTLKLIAFIENNYKKDLKAEDFEEEMNMSYRYLSSLVKKETGNTPSQMLLYYKLFLAKELLEYSDMEIKMIAEEVGFLSIHQFSRVFRRVIQMPPGAYRKLKRKGIREDVLIENTFQNQILIKNK